MRSMAAVCDEVKICGAVCAKTGADDSKLSVSMEANHLRMLHQFGAGAARSLRERAISRPDARQR
jgi:hypothetical protein